MPSKTFKSSFKPMFTRNRGDMVVSLNFITTLPFQAVREYDPIESKRPLDTSICSS